MYAGQWHLPVHRRPLRLRLTRLPRVGWLIANGHPTVAGILLFGRRPQQHLPYAQINAARFSGTDSSFDPVDRKDLGGRLLEVVDQAERFLNLHLPLPHEIRGVEPLTPSPRFPVR
jgi:predicted HTH transcriptional regulator